MAGAQTALNIGGGRTLYTVINPKAVTSNNLYGYVDPISKELYDGIFSKAMRDFSKMANEVRATIDVSPSAARSFTSKIYHLNL